MPLAVSRAGCTVVAPNEAAGVAAAQAKSWEIPLVFKAASTLRQTLPQKPLVRVIKELLVGLLAEKEGRERLNLNHWPEYGPRFLEDLAAKWKVQEEKRVQAIPAFLTAKRKEVLRIALAITDNLTDAEIAVAESDFDYLTGAVEEAFYPLAVKRNALDIVRKRQSGQDVFVPIERVFEAGDDCAADPDEHLDAQSRFASEPSATGCDAKDPLQILVDRKDRHLARTRKSKAKKKAATQRKYWWIRQKKWGQKLANGAGIVNETPRPLDY